MAATKTEPAGEERGGRLLSLDVFRGMTVAAMVLVNNPGTWGAIYAPLRHASWHGWTPTDLIFPFFLFIVGVSVTLALGRRAGSAAGRSELHWKILRRSLIIFALGLFLAGFPYFELSTIRIPGVLQRIAVCYLSAALLFLHTTWRTQLGVAAALLIAYWVLMTVVPVPGLGRPSDLDSPEWNLAAYVDRVVFGPHVWKQAKVYDPEGILSTIPAVATTLSGVLTGHLLRSRRPAREKLKWMLLAGAFSVALGLLWNFRFPINKALWTSSYVAFTSGAALWLLALCYWLVDVRGRRRWAVPFRIFGLNALAVFFLTGLAARLMGLVKVTGADGRETSVHQYVYKNLFASWASPVNASLLFAVCFVLVWLGLMAILYRRNVFIKV